VSPYTHNYPLCVHNYRPVFLKLIMVLSLIFTNIFTYFQIFCVMWTMIPTLRHTFNQSLSPTRMSQTLLRKQRESKCVILNFLVQCLSNPSGERHRGSCGDRSPTYSLHSVGWHLLFSESLHSITSAQSTQTTPWKYRSYAKISESTFSITEVTRFTSVV